MYKKIELFTLLSVYVVINLESKVKQFPFTYMLAIIYMYPFVLCFICSLEILKKRLKNFGKKNIMKFSSKEAKEDLRD